MIYCIKNYTFMSYKIVFCNTCLEYNLIYKYLNDYRLYRHAINQYRVSQLEFTKFKLYNKKT